MPTSLHFHLILIRLQQHSRDYDDDDDKAHRARFYSNTDQHANIKWNPIKDDTVAEKWAKN